MAATERRTEQGTILIALLWVLMAVSVLCISFAKVVRVEAMAVANSRQLASAYFLAQAGINETIYKLVVYRLESGQRFLMQAQQDLKPLDIDLGRVTLQTDIGQVEVLVSDEYGKININRAGKELLMALLLNLGVDEMQADIMSDSILDWRDPDEDSRLNGAESDYYLSLESPYMCKNKNLDTVEELLLIRGVTPELFYGHSHRDESGRIVSRVGLNQCVTVYGGSTGINVNSAPYPVLLAVGFPPEAARQIIAERSEKPFLNQQDFTSRVPGAPAAQEFRAPVITRPPSRSNYFSLVSTARLNESRLQKSIFAVIRLNARFPLKHTVVYWKENYFIQQAGTEE